MKRLFPILMVVAYMAVLVGSCQKPIPAGAVISIRASSPTAPADGATRDTIYAALPLNSIEANRLITFQVTSGLFTNGADTQSVWANIPNLGPGQITAMVIWQGSLRAGLDTISATTNTVQQYTNYLTLNLTPSKVDSISLISSSYFLQDTGMTVTLTGILFDSLGGMVSQGISFQFADSILGGGPAGGTFIPRLTTSDSSMITSTYLPPSPPVREYIKITVTALDSNNKPTPIAGTTQIFIAQ